MPKLQLRPQQLKILAALSIAGFPMTRKQIAKESGVDPTKIGDFAGPRSIYQTDKTRNKWPFPALDVLGFVSAEVHDINGKDVFTYSITKLGKEYLSRSNQDASSTTKASSKQSSK